MYKKIFYSQSWVVCTIVYFTISVVANASEIVLSVQDSANMPSDHVVPTFQSCVGRAKIIELEFLPVLLNHNKDGIKQVLGETYELVADFDALLSEKKDKEGVPLLLKKPESAAKIAHNLRNILYNAVEASDYANSSGRNYGILEDEQIMKTTENIIGCTNQLVVAHFVPLFQFLHKNYYQVIKNAKKNQNTIKEQNELDKYFLPFSYFYGLIENALHKDKIPENMTDFMELYTYFKKRSAQEKLLNLYFISQIETQSAIVQESLRHDFNIFTASRHLVDNHTGMAIELIQKKNKQNPYQMQRMTHFHNVVKHELAFRDKGFDMKNEIYTVSPERLKNKPDDEKAIFLYVLKQLNRNNDYFPSLLGKNQFFKQRDYEQFSYELVDSLYKKYEESKNNPDVFSPRDRIALSYLLRTVTSVDLSNKRWWDDRFFSFIRPNRSSVFNYNATDYQYKINALSCWHLVLTKQDYKDTDQRFLKNLKMDHFCIFHNGLLRKDESFFKNKF
ncbi:hypothetical protein IPH25_02620 [bacterium]|nr:MAG: hypothetical protein IPG37_04760 [bacterium]QQR62313.1 MAG: hypothetical protein IPH25_02620 [bacterium]QQR63120.1 MAG: hypothetical protein IPH67_01430 [bacterium]